ncbi:MAG: transposase [Candidatus Saccharimonadales bacterium]
MPGRNIIKLYAEDSYYHVYSRGVAKQDVFQNREDYLIFLSLFERYLSKKPKISPARTTYPHYAPRLNLIAYCLMPNHIHLLVYQKDRAALTEFMRSLMTSYSMYFNKKYNRVGPVFQSRYRASHIDHQSYLEHITRYIHLNPKNWRNYEFSSINNYRHNRSPEWLNISPVMKIFNSSTKEYLQFVSDYESMKTTLDELKWELADN